MSIVTTELCAYIRELREARDTHRVTIMRLEGQLRHDVDGLRTGVAAEQERDALKEARHELLTQVRELREERDTAQAYGNKLLDLLNRILGDEGPDAYLDGHVDAPSVPQLRKTQNTLHVTSMRLEAQLDKACKEQDEAQARSDKLAHLAEARQVEVGRLRDLLDRILGAVGPDVDAYLDGHVEVPSVPQLRADLETARAAHIAAETEIDVVRTYLENTKAEHLALDRQYMDRCRELDASKARERTLLKELVDTNQLLNEVRNNARLAHPAVEMASEALRADAPRDVIAELWCNGYGESSPYPLSAWGSREDAKAASDLNLRSQLSIDAEHYYHEAVVEGLRDEVACLTQALETSTATVARLTQALETSTATVARMQTPLAPPAEVLDSAPRELWANWYPAADDREFIFKLVVHPTQESACENFGPISGAVRALHYSSDAVVAEKVAKATQAKRQVFVDAVNAPLVKRVKELEAELEGLKGKSEGDPGVRRGWVPGEAWVLTLRMPEAYCVAHVYATERLATEAFDSARHLGKAELYYPFSHIARTAGNASVRGESDDDGRTGSGGT